MDQISRATDLGALDAIFNDVAQAKRVLAGEDTQFNRRVLVRTVYSGVEALVNWMKALVLAEHQRGLRHFSLAQLAMLRDESFYIDSSGRPQTQPKFTPLESNFRFAADLFLHRPHKDLPLAADWGSSGWQSLKGGLRIRNRLTHPRSSSDLTVSDEDLRSVNDGYQFVLDLFIGQLIKALEQDGGQSAQPSA